MTAPCAVDISGLRVQYPAGRGSPPRTALEGVTFQVRAGELFGVLGPNGGGKTTLFKVLSTAQRVSGGRAEVLGLDVTEDAPAVRERIGVVFQSASLDRHLPVLANLMHQGRLYGLSGPVLRMRAEALLARFEVGDRARDVVSHLSGGLQRRVEIAKGLLHRPSLLLLDEPTTGLDPAARRTVLAHLEALTREGVTVLLTTHLLEEADRCRRLAILDQGRLVALGSPEELKAQIHGDVVLLECADPLRLAAALQDRFGLRPMRLPGALRIESPEAQRLVQPILEAFSGELLGIQVRRPTLEDVFFHHTGRSYHEEGGA